MFDYTICNCKKVTYFDVQNALNTCKHFDDVEMPSNITVTPEMEKMRDSDAWLIVTPLQLH